MSLTTTQAYQIFLELFEAADKTLVDFTYNKYISLPGLGATVIKGEKFRFLLEKLKLN